MAMDKLSIEEQSEILEIKVRDPKTGALHTSYMNWQEYKFQANWYAELQGRELPYPEVAPPTRPVQVGLGLHEQISQSTKFQIRKLEVIDTLKLAINNLLNKK